MESSVRVDGEWAGKRGDQAGLDTEFRERNQGLKLGWRIEK